jgi:hypothetical protein
MDSMKGRGSDRLTHLHKHKLTERQLDRLAGFGEESGVQLVGWEPRGANAVESVKASFFVEPENVGDLIQRLLHEDFIRHVHGFPRGVLPLPLLVELQVIAGPA